MHKNIFLGYDNAISVWKSVLFALSTSNRTFVISFVLYSILRPYFFHLSIDFCYFFKVNLWFDFKIILFDKFCRLCKPWLHFIFCNPSVIIIYFLCLILTNVFFILIFIMNYNHFWNIVWLEKINPINGFKSWWYRGQLHYCGFVSLLVDLDFKPKARIDLLSGRIHLNLYERRIFIVRVIKICVQLISDILWKANHHLILSLKDLRHDSVL